MTSKIKFTPYVPLKDDDFREVELDLKNADFAGVPFQDGKMTVVFSNCRFEKLTIKNIESIKFQDVSVFFWECSIRELKVDEFVSDNISLCFGKCIVSGKIENSKISAVEFNNCIVTNSMFGIDLPKIRISYSQENITDDFWSELCKKLNIGGVDNILKVRSKFYLSGVREIVCTSNFEQITRHNFAPDISIRYEEATLDNSTRVDGLFLNSLSLSGIPKGKITLENLFIDRWFIYDFYPEKTVSFYNIQPITKKGKETKIGIHRCNLDKTWFDNIAFDQYFRISFFRTRFSKATFTSCDFPDNSDNFKFVELENIHLPEKKPRNYDKSQYEIILQMKKAMEDTGNFHEAQKLQAIAHDALKKIKVLSRLDKFILWINNKSNRHGLSIVRPFIGFFLFSIPIYIIYLWCLERIFMPTEIDLDLIGYYFSFVDITHRPDFLEKTHLTGWALFWDYIGKVFVGFFIYQFIAAFRKYGKR